MMASLDLEPGAYRRAVVGAAESEVEDALAQAEAYASARPSARSLRPSAAVGYVPPDPLLVFSGAFEGVGEEIKALTSLHGASCETLIRQLGLEAFAERPAHQLSGGQAARAAIAVTAASRPTVWVLDRCFEWLEPTHRRAVCELLEQQRAAGAAVVELGAGRQWTIAAEGEAAAMPPRARQSTSRPALLHIQDLVAHAGAFSVGPIDLEIGASERLTIEGPNGAGKTTLARALVGLGAYQGVVEWFSPRPRRLPITYAFQCADDQLFRPTVRQEICEPALRAARLDDQWWRGIAGMLGLEASLHLDPMHLGFSQRRLVSVAAALASDAPLVMLDEPTAFLSSDEVERLEAACASSSARGMAVVAITHDTAFAQRFADRRMVLESGRLCPVDHGLAEP